MGKRTWEKVFKDHTATVVDLDKDTQILKWSKEGTNVYSIEFLFRKNYIYIGGDVGSAVFNTTWYPKWNYDWENTEVGYFASKCECCYRDVYVFDEDSALRDCKRYYKDNYFYDLSEDEFDKLFNFIVDNIGWHSWMLVKDDEFLEKYVDKEIIEQMFCVIKAIVGSNSNSEYIFNLQNDHNFDNFNEFLDEGQYFGKELNGYFEVWMTALRMAKKQLEGDKNGSQQNE